MKWEKENVSHVQCEDGIWRYCVKKIPVHPIIFNTCEDYEKYIDTVLVPNYCIANNLPVSSENFFAHTTVQEQLTLLGFDGHVIRSINVVNYDILNITHYNQYGDYETYFDEYESLLIGY